METNKEIIKIIIGFITYGELTAKYLPYFLSSLKTQVYRNFEIMAVDNSDQEDKENANYVKNNFSDINLRRTGKNFGFAKAFNLMIEEAAADGVQYFLALNPDMILEPDMIARLFEAAENQPELGSVAPKVLKWDFENNIKTKIIDTCGINLLPGLRFVDLGQGAEDKGQFGKTNILGPSGAAGMYRISALKKIKDENGYFDENMFMYKEDCDLAYRLYLAGFKSKCVGDSIVYHDRSSGGMGKGNLAVVLNRKNKSRQAKQWAFLNQQIIFIKYWRRQNWLNKLAIIWFELKMLVFILFFETYLLRQFVTLFKIKSKIIISGY